jgi:hypothetical protein
MKRYSNIKTEKRWDGKRIFKTVRYPEIEVADDDIYIISNDTDFLDVLSQKYYGDATLWWIIALANNIGKGRLSVEGGLQLRIPTNISKIMSDYDKLNN